MTMITKLTVAQADVLVRIRQCEALRNEAHSRRDELIIQAHHLGLSNPIIGRAFGATQGRVFQILRNPHTGNTRVGKRNARGSDVQEPS